MKNDLGKNNLSQKASCISFSEIIIDETIYPRASFNPETVARYRETLEAGANLPPLVIMPDGRLLDGRHRYEAHKQAGAEEAEVIIEEPNDPDARAVELNLRHGRPLTREELREAAKRWYSKKPVTEIAKTLGVTRQTVQNWVSDLVEEKQSEKETIREKALEMRAEGKTQEEVALKLGIPRQNISRWENQECPSVKNLTHEQTENTNIQFIDNNGAGDAFESDESREDGQENDENDQGKEFPKSDKAQDLDLVKSIIGHRIETHYGTGGIVDGVSGPYEDGFYTITYKHLVDGKKCWINSITVKENTVLCEGVPLKITAVAGEKKPEDCEEARAARRENEEGQPDHKSIAGMVGERKVSGEKDTLHTKDVQEEKQETVFEIGRAAAEEERKKILPYSDMVKEFYNQLKKTSELAEQLVNRREEFIQAIVEMEADGMSITVLANAAIQACDIYFPRLTEARDMLEEAIKRGVKGVVVKDKFLVVKGGKQNGG